MKRYEFLVDAGVLVYYIEAENEDEAREALVDCYGVDGDMDYNEWCSPSRRDYLNAQLNDVIE